MRQSPVHAEAGIKDVFQVKEEFGALLVYGKSCLLKHVASWQVCLCRCHDLLVSVLLSLSMEVLIYT